MHDHVQTGEGKPSPFIFHEFYREDYYDSQKIYSSGYRQCSCNGSIAELQRKSNQPEQSDERARDITDFQWFTG
jgi:hypothetical protein